MNIFSYTLDNLEIKVLISMKNPLIYIIFKLGLTLQIFAENAPKLLKKICQNLNVRMFRYRTSKTQNMYSLHGSVVERQLSIPGVACVQAQANAIYLNLGFLHDKMNMRSDIKFSGAFRKIKPR